MKDTVLVALLGISGTLLGALAGVWFQFLIEKRRWRREDHIRFRDDLYQACVDVYYCSSYAVEAARKPEELSPGGGDAEGYLMKALEASTRVYLLGNDSLSLATRKCVTAALEMVTSGKFDDEADRAFRQNAGTFVQEARRELGVTIGERPPS